MLSYVSMYNLMVHNWYCPYCLFIQLCGTCVTASGSQALVFRGSVKSLRLLASTAQLLRSVLYCSTSASPSDARTAQIAGRDTRRIRAVMSHHSTCYVVRSWKASVCSGAILMATNGNALYLIAATVDVRRRCSQEHLIMVRISRYSDALTYFHALKLPV
jgi:hypothetical protein